MILPSEAVFRVVQVIVAAGPDIASDDLKAAFDEVIADGGDGGGVSDGTLELLNLTRLEQLFSDVPSKAGAIESGMRQATNSPLPANPPSAIPERTLVEYFQYMQFEGV